MTAKPARDEGSLSNAHERIAGLLGELNDTVDLVERLTRLGEHEAALKMVEEQRDALYHAMDSISLDVGTGRRRWRETAKRNLTSMVAAAALLLSSLALSFAAIRSQSPLERATAGLDRAREIADPIERLKVITEVVRITEQLPAHVVADSDLRDDLGGLIEDTKGDLERESDPDPDLIQQAEQLAKDVQEGDPPTTEPPSPPSTDQSPIEGVGDATDAAPTPPAG